MMSSYGFPTLLQYSRLTTSTGNLKSLADQARTEMVTGRIADLKTELGGSVGDAHLLRKAIDDVRARQDAATRALGRTTATQSALTLASDGLVTIGADILSAVGQNNEPSIAIAATQVEPVRTRVASLLAGRGDSSNNFRINVWMSALAMVKTAPG